MVTLFWAANFIVVKSANREIPPITFALLRFGSASLILLLALRLREGSARPPRGDAVAIMALGALGFGVYQVIWSTALQWIPAGDSALIIAATPVLTAMLAVVAGSDVLTRLKLFGGLISFVGVGIVIAAGPGLGIVGGAGVSGTSDLLALGYGLTLAAAVCWSVYTAWAAPHLQQHSPLRTTAWAMVGGSLVLLPFGLWEAGGADWAGVDLAAWGGLLYSAILPAGLANVLVFNAIRLLGPTRVTAYQFLVPFIAVVLGAIFIGEPIRTAQIAGGAVIVGGVALTRARSIDVGGWIRELLPD
ncbi:MAG TPA: DMT family transporter [Candidatus Limnocylindrales bacterium]